MDIIGYSGNRFSFDRQMNGLWYSRLYCRHSCICITVALKGIQGSSSAPSSFTNAESLQVEQVLQLHKILVTGCLVEITLVKVVLLVVAGHAGTEHREGVELVAHQRIDIE